MTYCIGMRLKAGLAFMSDTRTNAGVDNISSYRKMTTWRVPGERIITVMTAGNLATTQAVVSLLEERSKAPDERDPSILREPSMFRVARLVGETLREVIAEYAGGGQAAETFGATIILGGQIGDGEPRLFLIYPEGNFIEATDDTPFLQIGETKYGKPILVRAYDPEMSFEDAFKLMLVSFDSTIKANLSVDLPIDYMAFAPNTFAPAFEGRIERDDPYYRTISEGWGEALRIAFQSLPPFRPSRPPAEG